MQRQAATGRLRLPLLAALLGLGACSAWSPPAYSPELASDESCTGLSAPIAEPGDATKSTATRPPGSLEAAVGDAEMARKRLIRKAACLSADTNAAATALIAMSSLALFKGATRPNARDLAGLGVAGGATYLLAGGDEASTVQRRQSYFAGAEALSCALKAVEPYRSPLFQAATGSGLRLDEAVRTALAARDALRAPERALEVERDRPATETVPGKRAADGCSQTLRRECDGKLPASASTAERASLDACLARQRLCTATPDTTRRLLPDPSIPAMLADLAKARSQIDALANQAAGPLAQAQVAPRLLKEQSARIQTQVDQAVGETFKDLKAVLASLGGLQPAALKVAPAAVFAPAKADTTSAKGQSSGGRAAFQAAPRDELVAASDRLSDAVAAASGLRQALLVVEASITAVNSELAACAPARPAPPPAAPGAATNALPAPASTTAAPAASAGLLTTESDLPRLAPMLGLPAGANGEQVRDAVAACQRSVLARSEADGERLDAETMAALVGGRCRKAPA